MKKIGHVVIFIFIHQAIFGQYAALPKDSLQQPVSNTILKTNPLAVLWGPIPFTAEYRLVYETLIMPKQSLLIGGSYLGKSIFLTTLEELDTTMQYQPKSLMSGFRVQLEYRFYFNNKRGYQWGYYMAPHISYSRAKLYTDYYGKQGYYSDFRYLDYGIIAGNQTVIYHSALDLWIGLGTKKHWVYWVQPNKIEPQDDFDIIIPYLKIYFGFNFGISQ